MSSYYKSMVMQLHIWKILAALDWKKMMILYKFQDDMTKWPRAEFDHIFCYFIEHPGVYTRQQLMQWKSLDGYNCFTSGHVMEVKVWVAGPNCRLRMARVNPSQSSPDNTHLTWIAVRVLSDIIVFLFFVSQSFTCLTD